MLNTRRACIAIVLLGLVLMVPAIKMLHYADEVVSVALVLLAIVDSAHTGQWRRYGVLWGVIGVAAAYVGYSMWVVHSNVTAAIISDALVQTKPYVAFAVVAAMAPSLSHGESGLMRCVGVALVFVGAYLLFAPDELRFNVIGPRQLGASIIFIGVMAMAVGWLEEHRGMGPQLRWLLLALLMIGLVATRARYIAAVVVSGFMLTVWMSGWYRSTPGGLRRAVWVIVAVAAVAVALPKISYYFLEPTWGVSDLVIGDTMARQALYWGSWHILADYLPFGSGLASYASNQSGVYYSTLYSLYGIDRVYGLSIYRHPYINDAFMASMAQIGVVGICLVATWWIYVARRVRSVLASAGGRSAFAISVCIMAFLLIDCVAGSLIVQPVGQCGMMLLGLLVAHYGRSKEM